MKKTDSVYVAGHKGLVGSAIVRELERNGYSKIITKTRKELDLLDQSAVRSFFQQEKPKYVFLAAAKVGGIMANKSQKAQFIYENLQVQTNVIHSAWESKVKKLLFLGSSCIYPKMSPQPIREEYLMTGPLEESNDAYAIAKIAGLMMCKSYHEQYGCNFISVMPTNLYGTNDNFDLNTSHVLPALIRKFSEAKMKNISAVTLWGTGSPRREFLHVDDLAKAVFFLMNKYSGSEIVNIGTGADISIKELADLIKKKVGYKGKIKWDAAKPDGTPRKLLDVTKIHALGWHHSILLEDGLKSSIHWYEHHQQS